MKRKTSTWFESKVSYPGLDDNGKEKLIKETIAVESSTFTSAEQLVMENYTNASILTLKIAKYRDVLFCEKDDADCRWFRIKVQFVTLDEVTAKEKKTNAIYLVQQTGISEARMEVLNLLKGGISDYTIVKIEETPISDVLELR